MKELIEHYVKRFQGIDEQRRGKPRTTALEIKFCLTNKRGESPSPSDVEGLWHFLAGRGWSLLKDPYAEKPVGVKREVAGMDERIGLATGESQIELSLIPHHSLHDSRTHLSQIRDTIRQYTQQCDLALLCLGVQPITPPAKRVRRGARHQFWGNIGGTDEVYLLGYIADSHVHVDMSLAEAVEAVNTFHALAGAQIALTANSTLWCGSIDWDYKDIKEIFWNRWLPHPPNNGRIGISTRPFDSLEDYINAVCSFRPVFVSRDNKSIGIYEYNTFKDYFHAFPALGKTAKGKTRRLQPSFADIDLHDTFYWWNARISHFFTLENRANSQQPPQEIMTIPALTLGITENLAEVETLLQQCGYTWNELANSRESAIRRGLEATVGSEPITGLCQKMLIAAESGLSKRGLGEEGFLSPLWQRLQERECPADKVRKDFSEGGIERVVERYSFV